MCVPKIQRIGEGMLLEFKGRRYAIDKISGLRADYHIISHAHMDHIPRKLCGKPILSKETASLAQKRGLSDVEKYVEDSEHVELLEAGHILGSRSALIEDEILYTGDINIRDRLFLRGFKPIKARYLLMEATYGQPSYVFDDFGETVQRSMEYALSILSMGRRVVLLGYALGKSQILTELFGWYDKLIVHDSIHKFNTLYKSQGVNLKTDYAIYSEAENLEKDTWMLLSPYRGHLINRLTKRFDAVKIEFTGWATHPSYAFWGRAERGFSLSDHADFQDLMNIVKKVDPEKIFLAYGFINEFTRYLKNLGYDAQALESKQRLISDF
ncbi:MAG: hypothetical protein GTN80_11280 [Nitrososphaeria archaeon]|nr:hypothetical protein [Nitrososphaeria archaeon]NIQ34200.1 hypothetical protein [Nitrososphaeria archaeon]